jgi:hypothetical protein
MQHERFVLDQRSLERLQCSWQTQVCKIEIKHFGADGRTE